MKAALIGFANKMRISNVKMKLCENNDSSKLLKLTTQKVENCLPTI